jgi:hypothetical protein
VLAFFEAHVKWRADSHSVNAKATPFFPPEETSPTFPKDWVELGGQTNDGCIIMFCQGGAYDLSLAPVEVYVDRCRHILDRGLYGDTVTTIPSKRRFAVLIDCRSQKELANKAATSMISYFSQLNGVISNHYPGLINYIVIYSIPRLILFAVAVVKRCMSKDNAEAIRILAGDGKTTPLELRETYVKHLKNFPVFAHRFHRDLYLIEEDKEEEEEEVEEVDAALEGDK